MSQIKWHIRCAKLGHPAGMPQVYRWLAAALRNAELSTEEIEFIAARLEAVADVAPDSGDASKDKAVARAVCRALLLVRGPGTKTKHEAETTAFTRAWEMHQLVQKGASPLQAAETMAEEQGHAGGGYDHGPFLKAYREWRDALNEHSPYDGGGDPRID